jgi:hypothetical protein
MGRSIGCLDSNDGATLVARPIASLPASGER